MNSIREKYLNLCANWTTIDPLGNSKYTQWQFIIMISFVYNMITIPLEIFGTHIIFWLIAWITDVLNLADVFLVKFRIRFLENGKTAVS